MKLLSIGNSFSQDAQRYLHAVAELEGERLECVNLYIGGCSLKTHWENASGDLARYAYEKNGASVFLDAEGTTIRHCSIREALDEGGWDVVTFQQCSGDSGDYATYQPYLNELAAYVRRLSPARQWIHETWAYERDSTHAAFPRYDSDQATMYRALRDAYGKAALAIDAPIIRSGDVIQALRGLPEFDVTQGGPSLCRDGYHMNLTLGRYALAVVWFTTLYGRPVCAAVPTECAGENPALLALIRDTVAKIILTPMNGKRG